MISKKLDTSEVAVDAPRVIDNGKCFFGAKVSPKAMCLAYSMAVAMENMSSYMAVVTVCCLHLT